MDRFPLVRSAFTLLELLVVLVIIAVLAGLLLPAIGSVRESANRTRCAANLRQIALAVHAYHDSARLLPTNSLPGLFGPYGSPTTGWSWLARILPYVEQESLYRQGNIPNATLYQGRAAAATRIPIFLCPSDVAFNQPARADAADLGMWNPPFINAGQTNYKGVGGANWAWGDLRWRNAGTNGNTNGMAYGDGVFYRSDFARPLRLVGITDGLSNTMLIGEDLPAKNKWCSWPYANNAVGTCAIAPNARTLDGGDFDPWDWANVYSFRSQHRAGLQFALADGSVRFVSDSIAMKTYRALATIRGGEVVAIP